MSRFAIARLRHMTRDIRAGRAAGPVRPVPAVRIAGTLSIKWG